MSSVIVNPVIDPGVRKLCRKPYPNHKRGCPNYGKKEGCPPSVPMISEVIDVSRPVYAIYNVFPFGEHVENMRRKHPKWSQRQLECCLYWQNTARKQLREIINEFLWTPGKYRIVECPEAQGVNVTETMRRVDIELEWPPRIYAYQIVLAGCPVQGGG